MRVAVIRGDIPGPLFIADVEPSSQYNPPTEPPGQSRYVNRPSVTRIAAYLTAQGLGASASALITATVPVGGPINVSSATITGVAGLGGANATQVAALQELLAPRFHETDVVLKSFQLGNLSKYRSANFNPDPNRIPALSASAAIAVVADDGSTAFTVAATAITNAQLGVPGAGQVTITGTGLGNSETNETVVKFSGTINKTLYQKQIVAAGGSVSATSIVIPAALIVGATATTTKVRVRYTSLASNEFALV